MAPNLSKLVSKFWKLVSEQKYALTSRKYALTPRKYALTAQKICTNFPKGRFKEYCYEIFEQFSDLRHTPLTGGLQ